jgi:ATP-dependent helicase/nuclease subunit B
MRADVHVTPLARAMLRPFAAVVLPGCDARPAPGPCPEGLLPREAAALAGIASPESGRARALAFVQPLRVAPLTLLRRARDGAESLAPSRLVEQLSPHVPRPRARASERMDRSADHDRGAAGAVRRAEAIAPGLVPDRLSATALETLRAVALTASSPTRCCA